MRFRFNSIRERLFFIFLIFILFIVLVATIGIWFYDKGMQLTYLITANEKAMIKVLQVVKLEQDFLDDELDNPVFFNTKQSEYIQKHDSILQIAKDELKEIKNFEYFDYLSNTEELVVNNIDSILRQLEKQNNTFRKIKEFILQRGYQEYGSEGRMRAAISAIEEGNFPLDKVKILTLRRHEKDYLLRKELKFAIQLEYVYKDLMEEISTNGKIPQKDIAKVKALLKQYFDSFHDTMVLEMKIGINNQSGLRANLKENGNRLSLLLEDFNEEITKKVTDSRLQLQNLLLIITLISLIASILVSYLVAYFITKPVVILSHSIIEIVKDIFETDVQSTQIQSKDEVGKLQQAFNLMIKEIQKQLVEIKETTFEMEIQNKELNTINSQISRSEERMRSLNKVKDKLFSILSHDLRSPLHSITGFLDVLGNHAEAFSPAEIQLFAKDMDKSVKRILQLLENLLNWSLSQTGELDFRPENISVKEVFEENMELYTNSASGKGVSLLMDSEDDLWVYADRNMVDSILRNLISNAIKFTMDGATIKLSAVAKEQSIEISIIDTGVGIKQEHLDKIFKTDEQITTLGTSQEKGTGFGLLLCKEFVEKNGGSLQIKSEEGKGTEVVFSLKNVKKILEKVE